MRIDGWRIEGFGVFRDFEVRGLSPGLTLFLGPNEAGKSTLLGFLRGVLFGFPSRRRKAPQYPPLRGGRHGGRVFLCGSQGELAIERIASRRDGLRINGNEADPQDLQATLGGADESLFCSVFAFSLTEMQSFEWLQAEQVRERIFSAGIAGAGASARQVIDGLDAEAASLYRPRGASRIKDLLDRVDDCERRRKVAEADADRFLALEEEQEEWSARLAELSAREQDLRREQTLLNLWSQREQAQEELATLEPIDEFPSDPEARFAALNGRLEAARAVAGRLRDEKVAEERARAKRMSSFDDKLANLSDQLEEFHSRLALHRVQLETLTAMRIKPRLASWIAVGAFVAFASGWLTARGEILAGLVALFAATTTAGLLIARRVARNARVVQLEREVDDWEKPVRQWLVSFSEGEPLITEFLSLRERCRSDRESRAKTAALDEAVEAVQPGIEASRRDLEQAEEELWLFLRQAGAKDSEELQSRLQIFRKHQELRVRIAELNERLPQGADEAWKNEAARLLAAINQVQRERDEAVGKLSVGRAALDQIAESAALPSVQAELESLRSEVAAAAREWRVAKLAEALVARTLQEFTHTRQPAVLEEASQAFARVTGGAYQQILQSESGESLDMLDRAGQKRRPEELSRGTAEQLYLCLRLALASEFTRRAESLPIIMDDVLVNFDPERASAVARELAHISERRQILLFTCHPETARLFAEVAPGTAIIQLERSSELAAKQEEGD